MSKVVDLFSARQRLTKKQPESKDDTTGMSFEQIAEQNRVNSDRVRKERAQANKKVLKSYRIK